MHLRVASVGTRVHEDTGGPTEKSSSVRNELSTAARRAALERCAREGSREVDEGRESIREWAAAAWRERSLVRGKTLKLSCLSSGLVLYIPLCGTNMSMMN